MNAVRSLVLVILIVLLVILSTCSSEKEGPFLLSVPQTREMVEKALPLGITIGEVLSFLEQHSIEHSEYLDESRTIRAIIRDTSTTPTNSRAIQMVFAFDGNKQLINVKVEGVYTGP